MAFTAADVAAVEAAIVSIATQGTVTVSINGRSHTFQTLDSLLRVRNVMQGDVNTSAYGAKTPVIFSRVDD